MARIVVYGASETVRTQLSRLLASSGFGNARLCASASELRRTLNTCEDGIVVVAGAVADCQVDDLAEDFGESFQILWIGRPGVLSSCDSPRVFKLAYPCAGSAVIGAVEMLSQLHAMRLPRRTGDERQLVERAKRRLMRELDITEPEAHRRMQQHAMRHGIKMTEYAQQLLQGGTEHA